MINIIRRIKNLWTLSAYKPATDKIVKDFPTIKKKMATIVLPEKVDIFTKELQDSQKEDDSPN